MTGHMPERFEEWLGQQPKHLTTVTLPDAQGSQRRVGRGYEVAYAMTWTDPQTGEEVTVPLRVFMVQRDRFKEKHIQDLQRRLTRAEAALKALNGRRCDTPSECTDVETQAPALLVEYDVVEYLSVQVRWREQQVEKLVGRGGPDRGAVNRHSSIRWRKCPVGANRPRFAPTKQRPVGVPMLPMRLGRA